MTRKKPAPSLPHLPKPMANLSEALFSLPWNPSPQPIWRHLYTILFIAFLLRAAIALHGDFVIHPDEIMQYLETAHGIVFGNAVLHWEFVYGGRSRLVMLFIAGILKICDFLGLDTPLFYIAAVKLVFCLIALLIPYGLYIVGRNLLNEATGRTALLLGAFWYEFVGYAHKPMTEFITTALLFLILIIIIRHTSPTVKRACFAVAIGVLLIAIRFQYAPVVAFILLAEFVRASNWHIRLSMVGTTLACVALVGIFDYATLGGFLRSYIVNIKLNFLLPRDDQSSPWIFAQWLLIASGGVFYISVIVACRDYKRYLFILMLLLLILVPHVTQEHREYRFIFIVIPFWLLLFAHFLTLPKKQQSDHRRQQQKSPAKTPNAFISVRQIMGVGYLLIVSAFGICNQLPYQNLAYVAFSGETNRVNYIFNQDPIFKVYRKLASDDSVRGVLDAYYPYFNTGGYYYLHKKVPLYSRQIAAAKSPAEVKQYISHIIVGNKGTPKNIVQQQGVYYLRIESKPNTQTHYVQLPAYVHNTVEDKLIYVSQAGMQSPMDDFALNADFDGISVWKTLDDSQPVQQWKDYRIYPDSEQMRQILTRVYGAETDLVRIKNAGIEYADE